MRWKPPAFRACRHGTLKGLPYGKIQPVEELDHLAHTHRKQRHLTSIPGLGNLSTRFLSELERSKETAEIGNVLKALHTLGLEVIIQPRGTATPAREPVLPEGAVRAYRPQPQTAEYGYRSIPSTQLPHQRR